MPDYLFKIAREYELAFATERAPLDHDDDALAHARAIGERYPQAAIVTVSIAPRLVGRVSLRVIAADPTTDKIVKGTREIIARSRVLLAETGPPALPSAEEDKVDAPAS